MDDSELGIAQAKINAELNGLSDRVRFTCADVFELLPSLEEAGEKFDLIILDPPAFTKSRDSVKNAVKGYREINLRAMKLIRDGGAQCTPEASPGGVPHTGCRSPDLVGGGGILLSEILYFPGLHRAVKKIIQYEKRVLA